MLKLTLKRVEGPWFTIGLLNLRGEFFCFTLEDQVRPPGEKVPGKTAIPYGGPYEIQLLYSPKFKAVVPHILGVPGFTAIEIHPGNDVDDTDGCVLVGDALDGDKIKGGTSRPAYDRLFIQLDLAKQAGEQIFLDIVPANPVGALA